jgi:cystathionine beta-lyase
MLCSPHNPVGRVWEKQALEDLLAIARRHGLVVLSDEIHADLLYPGQVHTPLATLAGARDRVITTVAPSKTFNIPGLGLSAMIASDPVLRAAIEKAFGQLHVNPANPFSIVAFSAAYNAGEAWLTALMAYLAKTRDAVRDALAKNLPQVGLVEPEATYLLWLDCRGLGLDDAQLKRFMVQEAGVGLNPGTVFGVGGAGFMRMNIGCPRARVMQALENMAQAMKRRT